MTTDLCGPGEPGLELGFGVLFRRIYPQSRIKANRYILMIVPLILPDATIGSTVLRALPNPP